MLNDKKVPCIPPIFHDNKFVTDFSKKADLFNSFFAKQCSVIENDSVLPSSTIPVTDQYLQTLNSRRMILKESSVNSILIKLMVMMLSVFAC